MRVTLSLIVMVLGLALSGASALAAGMVQVPGSVQQGQLVIGWAPGNTVIQLGEEALPLTEDGQFVFGFGRDEGPNAELTIRYADGSTEVLPIKISQRQYDIQRIDGLPPSKVTPPPERAARLKRERGMVAAARKPETTDDAWTGGFIWPSKGRLSGFYGSQRVLNGIPKWPHFGLDIAAPTGTPVVAPAAGVVRLAEADFYYEGGIIIIDHGHNVTSTLFHLHSVDVTVGQVVSQGGQIGTIGATGRATGPHVDWRINWRGRRLDPALVLPTAAPLPVID